MSGQGMARSAGVMIVRQPYVAVHIKGILAA